MDEIAIHSRPDQDNAVPEPSQCRVLAFPGGSLYNEQSKNTAGRAVSLNGDNSYDTDHYSCL